MARTRPFEDSEAKPVVELFPHQLQAIEWLEKREKIPIDGIRGGILSLKMGMGKTLTAMTYGKDKGPVLIVASKSVMTSWKEQFEKFMPDVNVLMYHNDYIPTKDLNILTTFDLEAFDFVVTTYDVLTTGARTSQVKEKMDSEVLVKGDYGLHTGKVIQTNRALVRDPTKAELKLKGKPALFYVKWGMIVADESQKFANPRTSIYKAMMTLNGGFRVCLTGTPVRNYETDIWAQLRWCGLNTAQTPSEWKNMGVKYFQTRLSESVFSLNYEEAGIKMPEKIEINVNATLSEKEREIYQVVLKEAQKAYSQFLMGICTYSNVLATFTRLRQACVCPFVITLNTKQEEDEKTDDLTKWVKDELGTSGLYSAKVGKVWEKVNGAKEDSKVLIFSSFASVNNVVAKRIRAEGGIAFIIDGTTTGKERIEVLEHFKKTTGKCSLLMTYKVGSEGLNLTEAETVICVEPWWNNSTHNQAKARAWRIGQTKEVKVYNIVTENSIEEKVIAICEEKDVMTQRYLEGKSSYKVATGIGRAEMGRILRG